MTISTWDQNYLDLARFWADLKSKDPSTKVGCVIARPDHTIASLGYNGLPRKVLDSHDRLTDRDLKYPMTVHAELNAILVAREPLNGYTLYSTLQPCSNCTAALIQVGITRVVAFASSSSRLESAFSFALANQMLFEANVLLELV